MVLAYPLALWLLVLVPVIVLAHRRHRMRLPASRSSAVVIIRALALGCLILALVQPMSRQHTSRTIEVDVFDISGSLTDYDLLQMTARARQRWRSSERSIDERHAVVFDDAARVVSVSDADGLVSMREAGLTGGAERTGGSALADALALAASLIDESASGRIHLSTDGLITKGDPAAAAMRIGQRGIDLAIEPFGSARQDELILRSAELPAEAGVGATVSLRVAVESSRTGEGTLTIAPEAEPSEASEVPLDLKPGRQTFVVSIPMDRPSLQVHSVRVASDWDSNSDNNERVAATFVRPPCRIMVVEADSERPAARGLAELLGAAARVEATTPESLASQDATLADADLLVVANIQADRFPPALQRRVRTAVEAGLGVLFTGGRQSFGPGGYADSEWADLLPVEFDQDAERRDPSVTLVVIIDTSGSMTGPRLALAKEIARLAIKRLQPHDKVGIVEFHGTKRWAARIQSAANAIDIGRALNRLSAGGGTVILPAIEEAYYGLLNVKTRTKHVLIITDGGVETGPFETLISRLADARITTSTVMSGPGQHSTFLASLAQWGRGRYYAASDRFNLPEIILKQPENMPASPFVESPQRLVGEQQDPVLETVPFEDAPPVDGYVRTRARPTSDVLVRSDSGDPLLVRWRYGRGFVAALTCDLGGPWSRRLIQWPGAATLLSNLTRQIASASAGRSLRIAPVQRDAGVELQVSAIGHGAGASVEPIDLEITARDGTTVQRTVDPIRPGVWNALFPRDSTGVFEVGAHGRKSEQRGRAAFVVPIAQEVPALGPDKAFLEGLERISASARLSTERTSPRGVRYVELWPWLALAGLALVLLNVLIRRWPLSVRGSMTVTLMAMCLCTSVQVQAAPPTTSQPPKPTTSQAATLAPILGELIDAAGHARTLSELSAAVDDALRKADQATLLEVIASTGKTAPVRYRIEALLAARRGDFNRARQLLEGVLAAGRGSATVWSDLAVYLNLAGAYAAAADALELAITTASDPKQKRDLELSLVCLLENTDGQDARGAILRDLVATSDRAEARSTYGALAGLLNKPALALSLIEPGDAPETASRAKLLQGLFASRVGHHDRAIECFADVLASASDRANRRFAMQQMLALADRLGRLVPLADDWCRDPDLPSERLMPLLQALRKLGRVDDALALLNRASQSPAHRQEIERPRFIEELVATAIEAGRPDAADRALRKLIAGAEDDLPWRVTLARLALLDDRSKDARALFEQALSATDDPDRLWRLAEAAKSLALTGVAEAASAKALQVDPGQALRAAVWRAEMLDQQGDRNAALAELESFNAGDLDDGQLQELVDAFLGYDQPARAVSLLRDLVDRSGDEEARFRLAWLLEQSGKLAEAERLWRQIWTETTAPARRVQAAARLLELAAKNGSLADLAIELEQKLGAGTATPRELDLLVELYGKVHDAVSVAEILFTFARQTGDEITALRQLSRAYLRMGRLGQSDTLLRELLEQDPDHAFDYLQELMVLAVERQRPRDAERAIRELTKVAGDASFFDELSAGVFELLGNHDEAIRRYERVLTHFPERVELWLLWANAMQSAGRAEAAIARLQLLATEAEQDDLFLVAIDGLLNLEAGRPALRTGLQSVLMRLATRPDKLFLYDAAAELMEALGQVDRVNPLMEIALAFAGEQQGALLREMMDRARALGRSEDHIRYGQVIVGLDFSVPPQVLLELGEAFLAAGQPA